VSGAVEEAPLVAGRLYGLRTWRVRWSAGRPVLSGVFQTAAWNDALEPTKARCRGRGRTQHAAPAPDCRCGIYGMHPSQIGEWFEMTRKPFDWGQSVHGIVEAWGRVELHEDGFRAEFARPYAIVHVEGYGSWNESREIAEAMGVEHFVFERVADVAEYCEENGLGMNAATVAELNPYGETLGPERAVS
jgi:hypothetical protein